VVAADADGRFLAAQDDALQVRCAAARPHLPNAIMITGQPHDVQHDLRRVLTVSVEPHTARLHQILYRMDEM
jgi:hypothetical protein